MEPKPIGLSKQTLKKIAELWDKGIGKQGGRSITAIPASNNADMIEHHREEGPSVIVYIDKHSGEEVDKPPQP